LHISFVKIADRLPVVIPVTLNIYISVLLAGSIWPETLPELCSR